jgi:branched-chain amino acid transport system ATP-binding protein
MLALARGLMARPKLLLLDEPSLGLAPLAVQEVLKLIKSLKEQGVTILLVEQNVRQALVIADRGYILEGGRIILEDKARQLLNHDLLIHSYLGIQNAGGGYEKY